MTSTRHVLIAPDANKDVPAAACIARTARRRAKDKGPRPAITKRGGVSIVNKGHQSVLRAGADATREGTYLRNLHVARGEVLEVLELRPHVLPVACTQRVGHRTDGGIRLEALNDVVLVPRCIRDDPGEYAGGALGAASSA